MRAGDCSQTPLSHHCREHTFVVTIETPMRLLLTILATLLLIGCKRETPLPATKPATQAATAPATQPAELTYVDVIRASYPKMPATQPLGIPVDLKDAGHYVLPEPVYLDPRGDLWITRSDAPPTPTVLKKAPDEQIHLIR